MKSTVVTEYGSTDSFELREIETPEPTPGEIRIDVGAVGINLADIMQRRGTYRDGPEPPYTPGMEAAGTIDAVGGGVGREVGERVVAMIGGGVYVKSVATPAPTPFDVSESMSFAEAADFPVQFLTVYSCLHEWGNLDDDERVLIQAVAGGVGTAAVQLASHAGVEAFGTASTEVKLDLAANLGPDHDIQYTEEDFRGAIADETDGAGVDLVLDGVGGETFRRSLGVPADFSRLITYGAASGDATEADPMRLLFENKSVIGFHPGSAMQQHPESILGVVSELSGLFAAGELDVVVGEMFALEDAVAAHKYTKARKGSGKVVLEP